MKKKLIIIGVMVFVCTGLFLLSQKVQNSYLNNKVSTVSQVKSKAIGVVSNNSIKPSEKVVSSSKKSAANAATDTANQGSESNKVAVTKVVEVPKTATKVTTSTTIAATSKTTTATANTTTVKPEDKGPFNFIILDAANNNKVILEKNIDFDNVTVDYITCKLLKEAGIKYINEGEGSSASYFYSIAGITEKKAGPFSGWCFYVNGEKPGLGAGSYTYHKGDKVQWKYSTDALSN